MFETTYASSLSISPSRAVRPIGGDFDACECVFHSIHALNKHSTLGHLPDRTFIL